MKKTICILLATMLALASLGALAEAPTDVTVILDYIPNTNQLQLIVEALRQRDFYNVFSVEIIQREMEVHPGGVRPSYEMLGHTGYLVFGRKRS